TNTGTGSTAMPAASRTTTATARESSEARRRSAIAKRSTSSARRTIATPTTDTAGAMATRTAIATASGMALPRAIARPTTNTPTTADIHAGRPAHGAATFAVTAATPRLGILSMAAATADTATEPVTATARATRSRTA